MTLYGQLVVGPPGSGKTTYCYGMQQLLDAISRECAVINLDPGNDALVYRCAINVQDLVSMTEVMETHNLGPNGALLFCFDHIEANIDWLLKRISDLNVSYFIFDCSGQVELYTHHGALPAIIKKLSVALGLRLTCVHLLDSILCTDLTKYISGVLVSLSGQLMLELPHINILTKMDLMKNYTGNLDFPLEFYLSGGDSHFAMEAIINSCLGTRHPLQRRFQDLFREITQLLEDFGMVSFLPLDISDKESVLRVLKHIDVANGFSFSESSARDLFGLCVRPETGYHAEMFGTLQERYTAENESPSDQSSENAFR